MAFDFVDTKISSDKNPHVVESQIDVVKKALFG
jgi:hypothetical protein